MKTEPALIIAAIVGAIVAVLAVFGINIDDGATQAVIAGASAVVAIIGGIVTRSKVTPSS